LTDLLYYSLLSAVVLLGGWLGARHGWQWDWSANRQNSLSDASLAVLGRLDAPLSITSFAPPKRRLRRSIEQLLERYRRASIWIETAFVDPVQQPEVTRAAGVTLDGELLLEYGEHRETLQTLSEAAITDAIQRLLSGANQWIVALGGHGERAVTGQTNQDLGDFGKALVEKGFQLHTLTLAETPAIPGNASLLLLAGPQVHLLPEETARIVDFLEQGGHLLWLLDPGDLRGLAPLATYLGIQPLPGVIVDATGHELGIEDPTIALVPGYPGHSITQGLEVLTLFPGSVALTIREDADWEAKPLLATLQHSWNETAPITGRLRRDPELGEQAGPLHLGWALTRSASDGSRQRIAVIGDGDFLANRYLENAGNLDLGLRLVRWLSRQDRYVDIPARLAPDHALNLSDTETLVMGLGTLVVAPLILVLTGLLVWWRRQRA
jgi:ABC-type uncharacterized transport system involved in gliding motility auxiliary subunit